MMTHYSLPTGSQLQGLLEDVRAETGIPGIGLAVGLGQPYTAAANVGRAAMGREHLLSVRSRFEVGCTMKLFVSLMALELAAEGRLNLDAPIGELIPELADSEVGRFVRSYHLLSHTSGYAGLDISDGRIKWAYQWPEFVEHLRRTPLLFPPGRIFNYEHSEHVLIGEVIRRIQGQSAASRVQQRIFGRLGLHPGRAATDRPLGEPYVGQHRREESTGRFVPVPAPACGRFWESSLPDLTLTLEDHLRIVSALLASIGQDPGQAFSTEAAIAPLLRPAITLPALPVVGARSERRPSAYSLGCGFYGSGLLGRNGSTVGQTCAVRFHPQSGFGLAIAMNAWAPHTRDLIIERVCTLVFGRSASVQDSADSPAFAIEELTGGYPVADVVGMYRGSYFGQVVVRRDGDLLEFRFGRGGAGSPIARARPVATGCYTLEGGVPAAIGFFPDPNTGGPALMVGVHAYKRVSREMLS